MSKNQVSDFIQSGIGFDIRDGEPEFNEDGELEGFTLSRGFDPEAELMTVDTFRELLATEGTEYDEEEWKDQAEGLMQALQGNDRDTYRLRRLLASAIAAGRLDAGTYHENRWGLTLGEGLVDPEATQWEELGYWVMEEEDPMHSLHNAGPAYGLWNQDGSKRLGPDESRYLARCKVEREIRFDRVMARVKVLPAASVPAFRTAFMGKYANNVKECVRRGCWHGLLLTKEQKDQVLQALRERGR